MRDKAVTGEGIEILMVAALGILREIFMITVTRTILKMKRVTGWILHVSFLLNLHEVLQVVF